MGKIYAKQVEPAFQDSRFVEDYLDGAYDGLSVFGYDDVPPLYDAAHEAVHNDLEQLADEAAEFIEDPRLAYELYVSDNPRRCKKAIAEKYFPRVDGKPYSTRDVHEICDLITAYAHIPAYNYGDARGVWHYVGDERLEIERRVLELVTRHEWVSTKIRGCCQGDVANVFYDRSKWAAADMDAIEARVWNTGSEWCVTDYDPEDPEAEPDGDEYYVYCSSWDVDDISEEIAEHEGCSPDYVVLYAFDGYMKTSKYKRVC